MAPVTEDYIAAGTPGIVFGSCFNGQLCGTEGALSVNMGLLGHLHTQTVKTGDSDVS